MSRIGVFSAVVLLGLATGTVPAAEPLSSGEAAEPVRLYTNADLARFGPPEAPDAPPSSRIPDDWWFVQAFIDREYARLEAELDRALARSAAEAVPPTRPHYVLPYAGWYGGCYPYPCRGSALRLGSGKGPEPRFHEHRAPAHLRSDPQRTPPATRGRRVGQR